MRARILSGRHGAIDGIVRVPGSKSEANRALVCAMLARGSSIVRNVPAGDDTRVLTDLLIASGHAHRIGDSDLELLPGTVGHLPPRIDAGLGGTTSRFLTAVAALSPVPVVIDGAMPLRQRPMAPLHDALRNLGALIEPMGVPGFLPVKVGGRPPSGGRATLRADVSSQFISALMLIGPVLEGGLRLDLTGDQVSRPYVHLTADVMRRFGASVHLGDASITITDTGYSAAEMTVAPDFSSAAFPIVGVLIAGGRVVLPELARGSSQGDERILDIAERMGASVQRRDADIEVVRQQGAPLRPIDIDMRDCSDLVPPVAVACAAADGVSHLSGVGFIRAKESDRLNDLSRELRTLGVSIDVEADGLVVRGPTRWLSGAVNTHHDHRLAMALSLASMKAESVTILDPDVVGKSWPGFFGDLAGLLGWMDPTT